MANTCTCPCENCAEGLHCGESGYEGGFRDGSIRGYTCTFVPLESTEPEDYYDHVWSDLQKRR